MLKKILISLFIFLISLYATMSYATLVTDRKLDAAFQKFVSSDENTKNYKISLSDNIITINLEDKNYNLNYDLTDKPTFTLTVPIEVGMSYEKFKEETGNLTLPMLGYIAVANIQGVEIEDASSYFLFSYLSGSSNLSSNQNLYMVVDDLNVSEGVTIQKSDDSTTIYASEFGNRVMEFVNNMYKDKMTITDDTYSFSVEKQDETDTSCKLVSTLSVNADADFSKLKGYTNSVKDSFMNSASKNNTTNTNTSDNNTNKQNISSNKQNYENKTNTNTISHIATKKFLVIFIIGMVVILAIILRSESNMKKANKK